MATSKATKKPTYNPKPFEVNGSSRKFIDKNGTTRPDTSANIFESMLRSDAYTDLTDKQKSLYTCCKAQYFGKRKPEKDYEEQGLFQGRDYFYMNIGMALDTYRLKYTKNMRKEFYNDIKALIEHGFIKLAARGGGNGKKKSVYQFSAAWREWKPQNNEQKQAAQDEPEP